MSRLEHVTLEPPVGMDVTSSLTSIPEGRCRRLINLIPDRDGVLRAVGQAVKMNVYTVGNVAIDGLAWWDTSANYFLYNPGNITLFMVTAANGQVYLSQLQNSPITMLPTWGNAASVGLSGMAAGQRVRMLPFGSELLIAQDGAVSNWYINPNTGLGGTLGTADPANPPTLTGTGGALPSGTYLYAYTYVDYLGRESDLSPTASFVGVGGGPSVTVPGMSASDKYGVANIYRSKVGGVLLYKRATVTYPTTSIVNDSASDASLGILAPNPGENAPPLAGNIIAVHKNRVWMNVSGQPYVLQYSNFGSASQWSALPIPATDGNKIRVQSDNSDYITGLLSFYSVLLIIKRHSVYGVFGDDNTSFSVQPLQLRGCTATDTIKRCDDKIFFLGADGVYYIDQSYNPVKVSFTSTDGGIQADLDALYATVAGRVAWQNAVAWYVDRTYYIAIGTTVYAYSLDRQAWRSHVYSIFGMATINAVTVPEIYSLPPIAYVGIGASPWGVYAIDNYTATQTVAGIQYVSRPLPDRSTRKRVRRYRQYGSGVLSSGSVLYTFDNGYTETYSVNITYPATPEETARGCLFYYEPTPYVNGRLINITVNLSGVNVVLNQTEVEFQEVS